MKKPLIFCQKPDDVDVANQNVRMDRALVMEMVHRAPSQFTITPRNPDRALTIGGNNMVYSTVAFALNVSDLDHGRRVTVLIFKI